MRVEAENIANDELRILHLHLLPVPHDGLCNVRNGCDGCNALSSAARDAQQPGQWEGRGAGGVEGGEEGGAEGGGEGSGGESDGAWEGGERIARGLALLESRYKPLHGAPPPWWRRAVRRTVGVRHGFGGGGGVAVRLPWCSRSRVAAEASQTFVPERTRRAQTLRCGEVVPNLEGGGGGGRARAPVSTWRRDGRSSKEPHAAWRRVFKTGWRGRVRAGMRACGTLK